MSNTVKCATTAGPFLIPENQAIKVTFSERGAVIPVYQTV